MILLLSGSTAALRRYSQHPHLGALVTPRNGTSLATIAQAGVLWACDNDCWKRLDRTAYLRMLKRIAMAADHSRLVFVAVPDVVADARATLLRFRLWLPVLRYYGLPVAFVAQDGQEALPVPWKEIRCLFIGGSTAWKEGPYAARLIVEAKQRGVWVHVGRVNTLRRVQLMGALGADSFDGTAFSKSPNKFLPWMLRQLHVRQQGMLEVLC